MNITEIRLGLNQFFHKYLPFFAILHCVVINPGNVAARICIIEEIREKRSRLKREKMVVSSLFISLLTGNTHTYSAGEDPIFKGY